MCQLVKVTVEETEFLSNAKKTAAYLLEAICEQDFQSARLEIQELNFVIKGLEDLQKKKERKEQLMAVVVDMKKRGINIDFAKRASFLTNSAKNAVEIDQIQSKIHKKRQQA